MFLGVSYTTQLHRTKSSSILKSSSIFSQGLQFLIKICFFACRSVCLQEVSIGVDVSVLSICKELLANRRQRVVVDGATSEWIPIVSGVPQVSMLGPLLFILYTSEMFELAENRLYMPLLMTHVAGSYLQARRHTC